MGVLLGFLFFANMIGALVLLPALLHFLVGRDHPDRPTRGSGSAPH
jgi:predicted RND superfamily exporter protein